MNGPSPLPVPNTAEVLADEIRQIIVHGRFAPGEVLRQEALAERFGVSRSPVREALRLLEAEGLIVYRSNRGAIVASVDVAGARECFEIRRLLEPALMGHAVDALDDRALLAAAHKYSELCGESDPSAFVRAHWAFHEALYRQAGRPHMLSVVYRNQIRLSHRADLASIVDALRRDTCRIDKRILNACKRRDRKAALDLTTKHVLETERFVVALLTQSGAAP